MDVENAFDSESARLAQKYCEESRAPHFAPLDGICFRCKRIFTHAWIMEFRSLVFQYVAQVLNWLLVALTATVVIAIRKQKARTRRASLPALRPGDGLPGTTPNNRSITNDQPRQITDRLALYLNLGELHNAKCCSLSLQGKTEIWENHLLRTLRQSLTITRRLNVIFSSWKLAIQKPTTSRRYASIFQSWTNCPPRANSAKHSGLRALESDASKTCVPRDTLDPSVAFPKLYPYMTKPAGGAGAAENSRTTEKRKWCRSSRKQQVNTSHRASTSTP